MENPVSVIESLALKIAEAYATKEAEARASICVFLLGCYCSIHKPFLIKAKAEITALKTACLLMDDFAVKGIDDAASPVYNFKFNNICDLMLKSFPVPLPFIYAPKGMPECGDGHKYELVAICENPEYKKLQLKAKLFPEEGAKLPTHKQLVANFPIHDGSDFVNQAVKEVNNEIILMLDILHKGAEDKNV